MSTSSFVKKWYPARFTIGQDDGLDPENPENPYIVTISNQPLEKKSLLLEICSRALLVVCADGGANRLKDLALGEDEERKCNLNTICGDLDSIQPEATKYYEQKGVRIIKDRDQYSTDLMKCMKYVRAGTELKDAMNNQMHPQSKRIDVALFGGLGGRADQAFSQLHHLYTISNEESSPWNGDIYLIATESIMFLLEKGLNKIYAPVGTHFFTENVGIIPIGRPSIITTHGLEWDVTEWPTEFGGRISTSNHIKEKAIEIETTERVLFTLEFA